MLGLLAKGLDLGLKAVVFDEQVEKTVQAERAKPLPAMHFLVLKQAAVAAVLRADEDDRATGAGLVLLLDKAVGVEDHVSRTFTVPAV